MTKTRTQEPRPGDAWGSPLKISTILVPTDFSSTAVRAIGYAAALASKLGAGLKLLHVISIGDYVEVAAAAEGPIEAVGAFGSSEATELAVQASALAARFGIAVEPLVLNGPAPSVILEVIADGGADLVVMGTHGRTGIAHALMGSVAEEIVRRCSVPVLTVRGE